LETHASRVPFRARTPHELDSLAKTLHPAGWVLLQSTEAMQRWFVTRGLPCVVVGSRYDGIALPSVDRDYGTVCRHAVNQIVARGHKQLVLLSPHPPSAGDVRTAAGFREAVGKVTGLEGIVQEHDGSVASICAQVDKLMSRAQPPTAFLVCRARHVLTVIGHLLSTGVQVPSDVAVISRDDDSFLQDVVPTVARYSHNQGVFASMVSRVVMEMLRGELRTEAHTIMPRYIPGRTLG
jgi:DNA-binding LacI/PurR family transcriptional regulator